MWKIETFIEEDTRNIVHRTMTPQSPSKEATWDLTQFSQSPSAASSYFPASHRRSEISSLSKVILVLEKARSRRVPNLGYRGSWVTWVISCFAKKSLHQTFFFMLHERAHCFNEAASHQLPRAACDLLNHLNSFHRGMLSLTQNLMQICYSTCSVILNATATQYTCSLNGVYRPHWLVQWSHHCSHTHIPVHSPWLPVDMMLLKLFSLH